MDASIRVTTPADAPALANPLIRLLAELSPGIADLAPADVIARLSDERVRVVVAMVGDQLVATATLALLVTLTDGLVGRVEDVVVSADARGSGLGRNVMEALHEEARRLGVRHLELTSRPSRAAANALYQALGYERRDTNVYRLRIVS